MILTTTRPHSGYDFLLKYDPVIKQVSSLFLGDSKPVFPDGIKLIVFTGGEDVSPYLYDKKPHKTVSYSFNRDLFEMKVFHEAVKRGIPMLGICRGLQLINVLAGGTLVQHTTGHAGSGHRIHCLNDSIKEFDKVRVTSLHHQMVIPPKDAEVAAVSDRLSGYYATTNSKDDASEMRIPLDAEVEAVIYRSWNAVGVQFHPELAPESYGDVALTQALIEDYLL